MRQLQSRTFDGIVEGHEGEVFATAFFPDGTLVVTAGWDGYLRLWDPITATPQVRLRIGNKPLSACAVSLDGRHYLTGTMEGVLGLWDAATQTPTQTTVAHTRPIAAIALAPDGFTLASAGWDRMIHLRSLDNFHVARLLQGHRDLLTGCTFFPDGRNLLSWSADGTLRGWDTDSAREEFCLRVSPDRVAAAALSPDGTLALTGARDGTIKLWNLIEQREVLKLALPEEIRGLFFLLDGEAAVAVDAAGQALLLTLPDLRVESAAPAGHRIMASALSPDGRQLALGGEDGYLYLMAITGESTGPVFVTPQRTATPAGGLIARLFGGGNRAESYRVVCPCCRTAVTLQTLPDRPISCSQCRQAIRVNGQALPLPR